MAYVKMPYVFAKESCLETKTNPPKTNQTCFEPVFSPFCWLELKKRVQSILLSVFPTDLSEIILNFAADGNYWEFRGEGIDSVLCNFSHELLIDRMLTFARENENPLLVLVSCNKLISVDIGEKGVHQGNLDFCENRVLRKFEINNHFQSRASLFLGLRKKNKLGTWLVICVNVFTFEYTVICRCKDISFIRPLDEDFIEITTAATCFLVNWKTSKSLDLPVDVQSISMKQDFITGDKYLVSDYQFWRLENSTWHMRTSFSEEIEDFVAIAGTLFLKMGNDTLYILDPKVHLQLTLKNIDTLVQNSADSCLIEHASGAVQQWKNGHLSSTTPRTECTSGFWFSNSPKLVSWVKILPITTKDFRETKNLWCSHLTPPMLEYRSVMIGDAFVFLDENKKLHLVY